MFLKFFSYKCKKMLKYAPIWAPISPKMPLFRKKLVSLQAI